MMAATAGAYNVARIKPRLQAAAAVEPSAVVEWHIATAAACNPASLPQLHDTKVPEQ
jgi:hypothetical protein